MLTAFLAPATCCQSLSLLRSLPPFRMCCRYSVDGILDKNKDMLFQDFKRLMYNRCQIRISSRYSRSPSSVTAFAHHLGNYALFIFFDFAVPAKS